MTKYFGYKYLVNWPMIIEIYENPLGYFYCLLYTVRVNSNMKRTLLLASQNTTLPLTKVTPFLLSVLFIKFTHCRDEGADWGNI